MNWRDQLARTRRRAHLQHPAAGVDEAELLDGVGALEQEAVAEVAEAEQDRRVEAAGDGVE